MKNQYIVILLVLITSILSCNDVKCKDSLNIQAQRYEHLLSEQNQDHWRFVLKGISDQVLHELLLFKHKNPLSLGLKIKGWVTYTDLKAIKVDLKIDAKKKKSYLALWLGKKIPVIKTLKDAVVPDNIIKKLKKQSIDFIITSGGKDKGYRGTTTIFYSNEGLKRKIKRIQNIK